MKTLEIRIEGGTLHVDAEWVEKLDREYKRIGKWMDTNPEARADYERYIDAHPDPYPFRQADSG